MVRGNLQFVKSLLRNTVFKSHSGEYSLLGHISGIFHLFFHFLGIQLVESLLGDHSIS